MLVLWIVSVEGRTLVVLEHSTIWLMASTSLAASASIVTLIFLHDRWLRLVSDNSLNRFSLLTAATRHNLFEAAHDLLTSTLAYIILATHEVSVAELINTDDALASNNYDMCVHRVELINGLALEHVQVDVVKDLERECLLL